MNRTTGAELLLATSNPGKRREFVQLLPPGIIVHTLDEAGLDSPDETGSTFAENARLKAAAASLQSGLLTLADDSGLEVTMLGGEPGVRSARYAGEPSSDQQNRDALLAALHDVPGEARQARFVCVVSLASAGTILAEAEGTCHGTIATTATGSNGFGYDPIFRLPDGRTLAELPAAEKNDISHRARAYRLILPTLLHALGIDLRSGVQ